MGSYALASVPLPESLEDPGKIMRSSRLSLSAKVGGMCLALLVLMGASLLYLSIKIGEGEGAIANQLDHLTQQSTVIDRQLALSLELAQENIRRSRLGEEEAGLAALQHELAQRQRLLMKAQSGLLERRWSAAG